MMSVTNLDNLHATGGATIAQAQPGRTHAVAAVPWSTTHDRFST